MKGALLFAAILTLALLVIPLIALSYDSAPGTVTDTPVHTPVNSDSFIPLQPDNQTIVESNTVLPVDAPPLDTEPVELVATEFSRHGIQSFRILDESTGEVVTVPVQDYIRGAVAAEMPATFHPEALKAQAVAAHTYALHQHYLQVANPDPDLKGADFKADPSNMLVYTTEARIREFYGDNADLYWSKICEAADSASIYVLEYDDEPIVAAYHAISAGQTEDASNVWGGYAPYLQASDSEGDLLAPEYETTVTLSKNAVQQQLRTALPNAELPLDPSIWFTNIQRSESGYITSVDVAGVTLHGKDIRTIFDLRSHNMDIVYHVGNETFTFTVYGYGHGVGLSQYGADFMARQGYTFDEILRNYYTGATLKQLQF